MKILRRTMALMVVLLFVAPPIPSQHGPSPQGTRQIILDYSFRDPEIEAGIQQPYKLIRIPELDIYTLPGKPVVPFKTARILIPYGEEIEDIKVIPGDKNYLGEFYIQPGQEASPIDEEGVEPTPPDPLIYNSIKPYPEKPFSKVGIQWKRGFQILILNLYPLEYIPKSMDVSWFESLKVIVNTKRAEISEEGLYRGLARDKALICSIADNPEQLGTYPLKKPCLAIAQKPQPTPTPELAPGVKGPVAVEPPILPEPLEAPMLSPLAIHDIRLDVPRFSQNDSAWKCNIMETCHKPIGLCPPQWTEEDAAGCVLTSAAMVFKKHYRMIKKNPGQLNACMGDKACLFDWEYASNHCSEGKASYKGYYGFSYSMLVWALENSRPPHPQVREA